MKRATLVVAVLLIFISTNSSFSFTNPNPDEVVRQFYTWYIGRLVKDDFKPLKNRTVSLKYLTPQFMQRVPGLIKKTDADPIICAQDFDPAWLKNMKVDTPSINGNQATADVHLDGQQGMNVKMKVTLKKTSAGWRIDNVDCGY